jgi:hypothetical protein
MPEGGGVSLCTGAFADRALGIASPREFWREINSPMELEVKPPETSGARRSGLLRSLACWFLFGSG